ncbi:unnamed protein product [Owenia fusiformis]|uniref:Uncharacterized protein n=1 Tax=Owenia fusiformis TaxID=6347 RepID=A0A8S4PYT6_OWEFU|nr:unnamed protein product [Owenia fusiformis]
MEETKQTSLDNYIKRKRNQIEDEEYTDAIQELKPKEKREKKEMPALTKEDFLTIFPDLFQANFKKVIQQEDFQDTLKTALKPLLKEQEAKITQLDTEITKTNDKVIDLEKQLQYEQNQRLSLQLRIIGLPDEHKENLANKLVMFAAKKLDHKLDITDFTIYRNGTYTSGKDRPTTVRFNNMADRISFFKCREKLYKQKEKIYINEELPPKLAKIMAEGRKMKKENKLHKIWSYRGSVFVKSKESDEPREVTDLTKLGL